MARQRRKCQTASRGYVANALRNLEEQHGIADGSLRHPERSEGSHTRSWQLLCKLCDQSSFARSLTSFGMTEERLENEHGIADANQIFHPRGVPVGQANAAVTGGAADCLGIIRTVNTDAGLIQAHP